MVRVCDDGNVVCACGRSLAYRRDIEQAACSECRRDNSLDEFIPRGERAAMFKPTRPPTADDRKATPVYSGCLAYFPDALAAVSRLSKAGNDKHNPGQPLHWSKGKSGDHADALARHLLQQGQVDPETGLSHTVAVAWRALALLQTEIEASRKDGGK